MEQNIDCSSVDDVYSVTVRYDSEDETILGSVYIPHATYLFSKDGSFQYGYYHGISWREISVKKGDRWYAELIHQIIEDISDESCQNSEFAAVMIEYLEGLINGSLVS